MRGRGLATAGLVALTVAACSVLPPEQAEEPPVDVADVDQEQEPQEPVVADPVDWDTPATVEAGGGEVELVPDGVQYVSTEEISSPTEHDHPSREVFAVVRFTVTTDADAATLPHGWGWRQEGQEYGPGDGGHASTAPWMGAIPEVHTETVIMSGEDPTVGYATFDLPVAGGELTFTGADASMVRWTAPEQDQGEVPELAEWLSAQ